MIKFDRVEINPTELCNRKCPMCPRAYDYPNLNLHMEPEVYERILLQVEPYTDFFSISGRGEPFLCKNIMEMVEITMMYQKKIHIITNGDQLDKFIDDYHELVNLNTLNGNYDLPYKNYKLCINCYDSEEQYQERVAKWGHYKAVEFVKRFPEYNEKRIKEKTYINRAGSLPWVTSESLAKPCFILFEKPYFNWNGDVQLCNNDWTHITSFGNIMETPFKDIWEGERLHRYRTMLTQYGNRQSFKECANCDSINEYKKYYYEWYISQ